MRPLAINPASGSRPTRLGRLAAAAAVGGVGVAALGAGGCSAFNDHRSALRDLYARGDYERAAALLDDPQTQKLYGKNEQLLYWLDRGSLALANDDPETTIRMLELAEAHMEGRSGLTVGEQAAQWLVNDTARPYLGEPYESMYANVLKLLAQLEQGNILGGATVEARRLASKANHLRDKYLEYRDAVVQRGGPGFEDAVRQAQGSGGSLVQVNEEGEFIESPLGTFLTAVTFMHSGESANQQVAARRLLSSIRLQRGLIGPVDPAAFEGLGERAPEPGDVLVVALSGRGPYKRAERFGPIPIFDWPVYFELPVVTGGGSVVRSVRVVTQPAGTPEGTPATAIPMALVEDIASVARENHRRQMPLIYARALLRSSLKAGASFAATQAIRHNTRDDTEDLAALGSVIAGLAFLALTERADLRAWVFLPGQAHAALFNLPPGEHRVRVEYLSAGGGVLHATPWRIVSVPEGAASASLTTIVDHFWQ